jgi:benzoyl-CoA reductase/2-hydroxyglutaryl-CoA dehydratase subunit BcrC/BadD/HgdB
MEEDRLTAHLKNRPEQLREAKKKGIKIIGYFPGDYVPEEIIYASGAVPLCLAHGENYYAAEAALSVVPHVICPFARAQIGERLLKENPYYHMVDMLVAPMTCRHLRKVAEIWEYNDDMEIFKLGIPYLYDAGFELEYYTDRLRALKDRLQAFTGNEITSERLNKAIGLYNRMRELLKKISLTRTAPYPPLNALDFIRLNHASFYTDPVFMVDILDSLYRELSRKQRVNEIEAPRILLLGPNMAYGDYKVLELVEAEGGKIVIEDLFEGIRYYWRGIKNEGDLFESLAKGYLIDRIPCALMRSSAKKRLDFVLKLVTDFNVSGVIWYNLINCEAYDSESYFFNQKMSERNIPMLILESDYSAADVGPIRIRINAFTELLKERQKDD